MNDTPLDYAKGLLPEGYELIFLGVHGSHLYGLNTPDSDMDYKGVYVPSVEDMLLGKYSDEIRTSTGDSQSKNTNEDVDVVLYSVQKFLKLLAQGETIAIDMIHTNTENELYTTLNWYNIFYHKSSFYTRNMKAFMGYVSKQAHKYGVRGSRISDMEAVVKVLSNLYTVTGGERLHEAMGSLLVLHANKEFVTVTIPHDKQEGDYVLLEVCGAKYTAKTPIKQVVESLQKKLEGYGHRAKQARNNEGVDWKAMSHALRCGYQLKEIYETGNLSYPLKDKDLLLKVKQGKMDFLSEVQPLLEEVVDEIKELADNSDYPEKVDPELVDNLILTIYIDNGLCFYTER